MSAPMIDVLSMVINAAKKYAAKLQSAPARTTYVFGQRVPTKRDAENTYKQELRGFLTLATQFNDDKAIKLITASLDEFDRAERNGE